MKKKCEVCGRMVGVIDGEIVKHRVGRSTTNNVKPFCSASPSLLRRKKLPVDFSMVGSGKTIDAHLLHLTQSMHHEGKSFALVNSTDTSKNSELIDHIKNAGVGVIVLPPDNLSVQERVKAFEEVHKQIAKLEAEREAKTGVPWLPMTNKKPEDKANAEKVLHIYQNEPENHSLDK
jgi:hypothetical protein